MREEVFGVAGQRRRLRAAALLAVAGVFLVTASILMSPTAALAQKAQPLHIRAEKADAIAGAAPAATAHFTCELKPFNLSNGLFCYGPAAIRKAYGVDQLIAKGKDGTGQTIVIIDAYGSPTIEADLAAFDGVFGLPAPPSFQQIRMPGTLPFDNTDPNQLGWAEETSLDVQWAHAIAPGASIVLMAAVSNNDNDLSDALNYAIDHHLGKIVSESFGESEYALVQDGAEGAQILATWEKAYARARQAGISVMVSSGDNGPLEFDINGNPLPSAAAAYPASSPQVTTVGGTNLFFGSATNADPNGTYQGEVVWNDGFGASGGGVSTVFATPAYQKIGLPKATLKALGGFRGYPDVAYNAGVVGGVIVHLGFFPATIAPNAFYIFGGTSAGAPQMAGITSIGDQLAGEPLGHLNGELYLFGGVGVLSFVTHDITIGNNNLVVTGFPATPGWDLATGWGTPSKGLDFLLSLQ